MKKTILGLVFLSMIGMSFVVYNKRYVAVGNYTRSEEVRPDRRGRAENEVVINRVSLPNPAYNVYIFHTNGNRLLTYRYSYASNNAFTEAIVDNVNDSTFIIRLQSPSNQIETFGLQCVGTQVNRWQETK